MSDQWQLFPSKPNDARDEVPLAVPSALESRDASSARRSDAASLRRSSSDRTSRIGAIPAIVSVVVAFPAIRSGPLRSARLRSLRLALASLVLPARRRRRDEEEEEYRCPYKSPGSGRQLARAFRYSKSRLAASASCRCKRTLSAAAFPPGLFLQEEGRFRRDHHHR